MVHTPASTAYARAGDDVAAWLERAGDFNLGHLSGEAGKPRIQVGGVNVYSKSNANKLNAYRTKPENHLVMSAGDVVRLGAFCAGKVTTPEILALSLKMAFEGHVKKRQSVLAKRYATRTYESMLKRAWQDDDVRESSEFDLIERYRETVDALQHASAPVDAPSASSYMASDLLIVDACLSNIHLPAASLAKKITEMQELSTRVDELSARGNWTVFAHFTYQHPVNEVTDVLTNALRGKIHLPLAHYHDLQRLFEIPGSKASETTIANLAKRPSDDLAALQLCCLFISGKTISAFRHDIKSRTILSCVSRESIKDAGVVDHLDALCSHLPQFLPNIPIIGRIVPYGLLFGTQLLVLSPRCAVSCPFTMRYIYLIGLPEDEVTLARGAQPADEVSAVLQDGEFELMRNVLCIETGGTRDAGSMIFAPFDPNTAFRQGRCFRTTAGGSTCNVSIDAFPSGPLLDREFST